MRFACFPLMIAGMWLPAHSACAQAGPPAPAAPLLLREVDCGWITDRTLTVAGHEFLAAFSRTWHEQPLNERYPLAVREQPSARRGTQVIIDYGQQRMFQAVLPANRSKLPALAQEAALKTYQNVVDAEVRNLLFRDADLAPDEL